MGSNVHGFFIFSGMACRKIFEETASGASFSM
jgi:hypothetical protein